MFKKTILNTHIKNFNILESVIVMSLIEKYIILLTALQTVIEIQDFTLVVVV